MTATLHERVALVTGGGRGIGKGVALELARRGARVAINYVVEPELADATVKEIAALGADAFSIYGDVSAADDVRTMVASTVEHFGGLDILVNNAGFQTWGPFLEIKEDDWDRVIATNLKGTFLCTQAAAAHMKDHGGGAIVNIGSGSNKEPFPGLAAYTASKGGIEMLTRVTAVELGPFGIRVNCVAPGAIEVERTKLEADDFAGKWSRVTPLQRIGTPLDVAHAVAFLAGDEASFITGQTLFVDGGLFTQARWAYEDK